MKRLFFITFLLCFTLVLSSVSKASNNSNQAGNPQSILLINSYHLGYKWSDDIYSTITEEFQNAEGRRTLYLEYLDSKRFQQRDHWSELKETLIAKYKNIPLSLLVVSDNNALEFLLSFRSSFRPDVPVIFCGINFFQEESLSGESNITGVIEEVDLLGTIQVAIRQNPLAKKLVFIGGLERSSEINFDALEKLRPALEKKYDIEIIKKKYLSDIERDMRVLQRDDIAFLLGFPFDENDEIVSAETVGKKITLSSKAPVYSMWDFFMGSGIVGGHLLRGVDQGEKVVDLAEKIFSGTPVSQIPIVMDSPATYTFDYMQMQRFDIDMENLPSGHVIENKPFSFYQTYKKMVHAVLGIVGCLVVLVILLLFNIVRRKKAEKLLFSANLHLEERVRERTIELRDEISERKTAQLQLKELSSLNEHIVSDSSMGIAVYEESGSCVTVNDAICSIIGGSREDLLKRPYTSIDTWKSSGMYDAAVQALQRREPVKKQIHVKTSFGKDVWINCLFNSFEKNETMHLMLLVEDITEQKKLELEREQLIEELQDALVKVKTLSGLLPICAQCKMIRDDKGYWKQIELYIAEHADVDFTHSMCPNCANELYGDKSWFQKMKTKP